LPWARGVLFRQVRSDQTRRREIEAACGGTVRRVKLSLMNFRALACILLGFSGCTSSSGPEVVVYTSVDEPYARPILRAFTEETGIRVRALYDTEAAKTVGLARRLLSERPSARCDVFWNNEILQTLVLKEKDVFEKFTPREGRDFPERFRDGEGYFTCLGGRLRVLLVRPKAFENGKTPRSVFALADPNYARRGAVSQPVAGTTLTHAAALCVLLGEEKARRFFERMVEGGVKVVPGNAAAKDCVVEGEADFCLTDSDDALKALSEDPELEIIVPDQGEKEMGAFLIPGSVALIKGAPHRKEAERLIEYLLRPRVAERLLREGAFQIPLRGNVKAAAGTWRLDRIRTARVSRRRLLEVFPRARDMAVRIFLR